MDKSPIVTLNGLNTVYTDLLKRIEALGNIYHIKGSYKTLEELIDGVTKATEGDAYNVVNDRLDKDPTGRDVEENANYVCIKGYTGVGVCTRENWTEYWFRINSAFEVANDKSLGLIRIFPKTNEDIPPSAGGDTPHTVEGNSFPPKEGNNSSGTTYKFVSRKLLLDKDDKAYVNIPVAANDTYGVIDTHAQTFAGNKTFEGEGHFKSGVHITGKLETASASGSLCSLIIAPTDADTEVGDVYVGGTLTVANDAVFNDVKGTEHKLVIKGANDDKDYAGSPIVKDTSTIGNMNVGGTLTVSNLANVKTVEASNATFNIIEQADIKKFKAIENLSDGVANLTVKQTATVGTVNAGTATFNINNEATIANLSATNLNVNNKDTTFDNKATEWNQVDVLNVTNDSTSAELNVSTRADISNVSATNLNVETINANEFNGGTGANKGTLNLSYGTRADVENISATGTVSCSNINVKDILSTDGSISFENASTVNAINSSEEKGSQEGYPISLPTRNTVINAGEINVGKVYSESSALTFTSGSTVSQIQSKEADSTLGAPARATVVNASTVDVNKVYSSQGTLEFTDATQNSIVSSIQKTASRDTVINATTIDVATLTGREGSSDKDLTFTGSAKVTTIANKSTELKAKTIDVQALKGSTDNGNTINRDLTFTDSAKAATLIGGSVSASQINVSTLKGSSDGTTINRDLTFTNSATVSNITNNTTTLTAKVIDVNKLSSNSGTLNVGDGGTVTTNGVSINGSTGNVVATTFEVRGAGTLSNESGVTKLSTALHIAKDTGKDATASNIASTNALKVDGGIYAPRIGGVKVYGAVWNDLVDCIEVDDECELEYGRCYAYNNGKFTKTSKYADKSYIGIHSDTSGFEMGDKGDVKQLKASVAGYVLAYVDAEYPSGTPLTCSKHGMLTKAHFLTRILHPEMVIATYWKNEPKFVWGAEGNEIEVKGRHWVRIK